METKVNTKAGANISTARGALTRKLALVALLACALAGISACTSEQDDAAAGGGTNAPATNQPRVLEGVDTQALAFGGETTAFYIDLVNAKPYPPGTQLKVNGGGEITINGWGVDIKNKATAAGIIATVDDKTDVAASYGEPRKDVSAYLKDLAYINSGFTVKIPTADLAKGAHDITFKLISADKKQYFKPQQKVSVQIQ